MLLIYTMKEIQILHWLLIVFFVGLVIFYFVQRSSVIIGKEGLETNSTMPSFKIYTTQNGTKLYLQAQPDDAANGNPIPTVSEYSEGTSFYIDSTSFQGYKLISSVDNNYFLRLFGNLSGDSKISSQTGFITSGDYSPKQVSQQLGTSNLSTPISNNQQLFNYNKLSYYAETTPPVVTPSPLPSPPVVTPSPLPSPPVVTPSPLPSPPFVTPLPIIPFVTPSPLPSPPVVTPSPIPSPPVVTPSPLPSPPVVTPSPGPTPPNMICTPAGSSGSGDQINVHQSKYNYNLG